MFTDLLVDQEKISHMKCEQISPRTARTHDAVVSFHSNQTDRAESTVGREQYTVKSSRVVSYPERSTWRRDCVRGAPPHNTIRTSGVNTTRHHGRIALGASQADIQSAFLARPTSQADIRVINLSVGPKRLRVLRIFRVER